MSRKAKWGLAVGLLAVYAVGVAVIVLRAYGETPRLFSSPTATRDGMEFRSGQLGILTETDRDIEDDWPADVEMSAPVRVPGDPDGFLLDWAGEPDLRKRPQPDRWAMGLEGDDEIELAAFATWYPHPDDDVSADAEWTAEPTFRDARSLTELSAADLDRMGVPGPLRLVTPSKKYRTPVIRLLFRTRNMEVVRILDGQAGDVRTGAVVTHNLDDLGAGEPMFARSGEWSRFDLALLAWHDIPLKLHVQVLTGEPEWAELEQKPGAQVGFGDRLRIQWLAAMPGRTDLNSSLNQFEPAASVPKEEAEAIKERFGIRGGLDRRAAWITEPKSRSSSETPKPLTLVRATSDTYLESHCGWVRNAEGDIEWAWDRLGEADQMMLATTGQAIDLSQPLRLVLMPRVTELTWELPGLPDAPNPRDIENLFDLRLPRISVPEDPETAEDHFLGYLAVATQTEWDTNNLWDDRPPPELPADRTFRNQSPQELLEWYLSVTPGATVRYDEDENLIYFNEERPSWWERFIEWLEDRGWYF